MSFRDIGYILKEAGKQEEQTQMQSISSQAYRLFSEGKTVLQVAIALNLRDHEVTTLYTEYCNLSGLPLLQKSARKIICRYGLVLFTITTLKVIELQC